MLPPPWKNTTPDTWGTGSASAWAERRPNPEEETLGEAIAAAVRRGLGVAGIKGNVVSIDIRVPRLQTITLRSERGDVVVGQDPVRLTIEVDLVEGLDASAFLREGSAAVLRQPVGRLISLGGEEAL